MRLGRGYQIGKDCRSVSGGGGGGGGNFMATFTHMPPCHRKRALQCFKMETCALIGYFSVQSFECGAIPDPLPTRDRTAGRKGPVTHAYTFGAPGML